MLKIKKNMTLDELESWGSIVDFGSELIEGEAKVFGEFTVGNPDIPINGGYFGVTKGIYRMKYPFSEQATIVTGQITLTDEKTGEKWILKEGDSWVVEKDTELLWEVNTDFFIKHYFCAV